MPPQLGPALSWRSGVLLQLRASGIITTTPYCDASQTLDNGSALCSGCDLQEGYENCAPKTGTLAPMLAERWEVLEEGRAWRFSLRKGVQFHDGHGEMTAEDVKFTFATIAKEGSANSLGPEFRLIKSMDIEDPYTITIRFEKPFVAFGNKVTQGLLASVAFIQSKKYIESVGEEGAERHPVATGPWKFVEHVRGDRIVYEAVENH